jgi:putative hydroxymethylpyrimidine transport system ATP-binding protein
MSELSEVNAISVRFNGSISFDAKPLFAPIDFTANPGQWTCLLGPSGIGKSTVLRLLAGLPTAAAFTGQIDQGAQSDSGAAQVAYMAQSDSLAPWLNVRQNMTLGARLRGEVIDPDHVDQMLSRVSLSEHADKRPSELSGGMRQRAALARTLIEQCPIVLLDEPFCALDARTRAEMQDLAYELLGDATVVLATHDPAEAVRLADQMFVLFESGLHPQDLPASIPLRAHDDPDVLSAQASLMSVLRRGES